NRLQKRVKGTGLGLPLCRRLAELMGGSVRVQSRLGQGSTFFIRVPLHYQDPNKPTTFETQRQHAHAFSGRALIIDDSDSTRYVLRKLLVDFDVIEAADGLEGLNTALALLPDLIFLDLNMPGLDGYSVLNRLREGQATREVPVIIVTSQPLDAADYDRLQTAQAVLTKQALNNESLRPLLDNVMSARSLA
ncbi:MAG TPA: response regulator, partial [Burkholderiales bacterium]|nr:response regulator [Burkholderiales bacterium]